MDGAPGTDAGRGGRVRVAHVIPGLGARQGGPAQAVVRSSLALRELGVDCAIYSTDLAEAASAPRHTRIGAAELPAGAEELDVRLFPARAPRRFAYAPDLDAALGRELAGFDLVHVHSLYLYPQLAAYRRARAAGLPWIVSPCGVLDPALRGRNRALKAALDRLYQRRLLDGAAALHYKTEEEAALAADLGLAAPAVVVPNGVDLDEFAALPEPEPLDFDGPVVLTLGRLSHKKGLDLLVDALARMETRALLVVAGPDDEQLTPRLAERAARAGVADRVRFPGMLRGRERLAAFASADVFALPSRTENFGTAVLEALAAGLPTVISPAVNLAPEPAVVAPLDAASFAAELDALLGDGARRRELAAAGRRYASRYDWSTVAPALKAMYEGAL